MLIIIVRFTNDRHSIQTWVNDVWMNLYLVLVRLDKIVWMRASACAGRCNHNRAGMCIGTYRTRFDSHSDMLLVAVKEANNSIKKLYTSYKHTTTRQEQLNHTFKSLRLEWISRENSRPTSVACGKNIFFFLHFSCIDLVRVQIRCFFFARVCLTTNCHCSARQSTINE